MIEIGQSTIEPRRQHADLDPLGPRQGAAERRLARQIGQNAQQIPLSAAFMHDGSAAIAGGDNARHRQGRIGPCQMSERRILEGEFLSAVGVAADLEDDIAAASADDMEVEVALTTDPRERAADPEILAQHPGQFVARELRQRRHQRVVQSGRSKIAHAIASWKPVRKAARLSPSTGEG